jgi:hypothetical protein
VSFFFVPSLSRPWSIVVSYDNKRGEKESIPNIEDFGFQLLGLNNFTHHYFINNLKPHDMLKMLKISPYWHKTYWP